MKLNNGLILLLFLGSFCSYGFFPPANKSTPSEMLDYRRRKKIEYSDARLTHEQQMIASKTKVEADLNSLPWTTSENRRILDDISVSRSIKSENVKNENMTVVYLIFLSFLAAVMFVLFRKRNIFPLFADRR